MDVKYMSTFLDLVYITNDIKSRLNNELNTTLELNNIGTLLALLKDAYASWELSTVTSLLNNENQVDGFEDENTINKNKDNRLKCKMELKTFFPTYPSPTGCMESWDTLARTDFSKSKDIYGKKHIFDFVANGWSSIQPISIGDYLSYSMTTPQALVLSGKTLIIELDNTVGTYVPAPTDSKWYVLDLWSWNRYFVYKDKKCDGITPDSGHNWLCKIGSTIGIADVTNTKTLTFTNIGMPAWTFVIGNTPVSSPAYKYPIGSKILKVSIQ